MAEKDLKRFIQKVNDLKHLVDSLELIPGRKVKIAACSNHNQVVQLAQSWGYEIGNRWGERDSASQSDRAQNLFSQPQPPFGEETRLMLKKGEDWYLEMVLSNSFSSPEGCWLNQSENEWLLLVKGSACLRFKENDEELDLSRGDYLHIPPFCEHRIERTDPFPGTTWLSFFWK